MYTRQQIIAAQERICLQGFYQALTEEQAVAFLDYYFAHRRPAATELEAIANGLTYGAEDTAAEIAFIQQLLAS